MNQMINTINKGLLTFLLLIGMAPNTPAQEPYYYYKGEKQYLALDRSRLNVLFDTGLQELEITTLTAIGVEAEGVKPTDNSTVAKATSPNGELQPIPTEAEYRKRVRALKENKQVLAVYPNYLTPDNASVRSTDYFKVKLKQEADYPVLEQFAREKRVQIVERNQYMPLWYILKCTEETADDMLTTANSFHESGLFASAEPDLHSMELHSSPGIPADCANDPYFSQQWGLYNTRQPGIDIGACQAWEITQGEGVKVAVFDTGVDLTHPDLEANISSNSYDAESGSSPSQIYQTLDHGTHCAGIIGAIKDNGIQISGVAPKCTLIPISYGFELPPMEPVRLADGMNWAWKNGADVINCSWGGMTQSNELDEAIDSALVRGRGGKGTIVVFSTGNKGLSEITYPANSHPDILSVGAIDVYGTRMQVSNYGSSLDLVAPGDSILSTLLWSTTPGYISGTSMAAPFVSGVAALVISRNPFLTGESVRRILKKSAQKIGKSGLYPYQERIGDNNGTWYQEVGYGMVNANAAVQAACDEIDHWGETVTKDTTITGCNIHTSSITVKSGTSLTYKYCDEVSIFGEFEVEQGATLEITNID